MRIGRVHFSVPVVAEAEHLDLTAEGVDVLLGGGAGVRAGLDGVLLGRQAEGVPAHRVQHVEAAHPPVAGQDVGGGVALRVADVQAGPAGVREHVEDVELRLVRQVRRAEGLVLQPVFLPARLDRLGVVTRHDAIRLRGWSANIRESRYPTERTRLALVRTADGGGGFTTQKASGGREPADSASGERNDAESAGSRPPLARTTWGTLERFGGAPGSPPVRAPAGSQEPLAAPVRFDRP